MFSGSYKSTLELLHCLLLVRHDDDGGDEADNTHCVLGVELGVLKVKLENKVLVKTY